MEGSQNWQIQPLNGPVSVHDCLGLPDGDWIVYKCPECDYRARDNLATGEFEVYNAKADVNHRGFYSLGDEAVN